MARPVALITNFKPTALPRILHQIAAGPPVADWYIGHYGISKKMAERITAEGFRYAPICAIQPQSSNLRARRQLRKHEKEKVRLHDPDSARFAGQIPATGDPAIVPPSKRRAWGIEFGRRYRDYMRRNRDAGVDVHTWQFDEIVGKCATNAGFRAFVGGILRGLAEGRPELEDELEQGFVWFSFKALTELDDPADPADDVARFWEEVTRATLFLVGEEYPEFTGLPTDAARVKAKGHKRLSGSLQQLRRKYICGMTPGWKLSSPGLGGNVGDKTPDDVTDWRRDYIDARLALQRPRGYGQFSFTGKGNLKPEHLDDAVASLRFASERLAS
jgi:hypothetical protein